MLDAIRVDRVVGIKLAALDVEVAVVELLELSVDAILPIAWAVVVVLGRLTASDASIRYNKEPQPSPS